MEENKDKTENTQNNDNQEYNFDSGIKGYFQKANVRRKNLRGKITKNDLLIRILIGGYLLYLTYDSRGIFTDKSLTGFQKYFLPAITVVMALFGAYVAIRSLIMYIKGQYDEVDEMGNTIGEEEKARIEKEKQRQASVMPAGIRELRTIDIGNEDTEEDDETGVEDTQEDTSESEETNTEN